MDSYLSVGSTSLLSHDAIIPRLRVMRNTIAPTKPQGDVKPSPALARSSSSSSSTRRRAYPHGTTDTAEDFSRVARASTSTSDSAAARLRDLTRRVPLTGPPTLTSAMPARSSSPELVHFDTASEAGTILRPASRAEWKPHPHTTPMPSDLDSDLDRMAENAFNPHPARPKSAQEKLRELVTSVTTDDERVVTPPKLRMRTSSFTTPPQRQAPKRVSLSDEEVETTSSRHSSDNRRSRKERSSTPSIDVLKARLNSPSVHNEVLNDTPAAPRVTHPLYAELESANLSGELPNPTPHHSFTKHPPFRTSTPRNPHDRTASVDSDQSSYTMSPFRASSALRPPLQLPPANPTASKGSSTQPKIVVGRRKKISINGTRLVASARSTENMPQEYSDEDEDEGDGLNRSEHSREGLPASSSSFQPHPEPLGNPEQPLPRPLATSSTTTLKSQRRPSPSPSSASNENRSSPSPRLATSQIVAKNSPSPRLANAQPVPKGSPFAARVSGAIATPTDNFDKQYNNLLAVIETENENEAPPSPRKTLRAQENTLRQEESLSAQTIRQEAGASQNIPNYHIGTLRSEYDAYVKEQRAARDRSLSQSEGLSDRHLSTSSAVRTASQQLESPSASNSTIEAVPRPYTPPLPAASTPLPPSPTVDGSPTKQPLFSKDRDLERLRKATVTATTSPRKNHQNRTSQAGGDAEPHSHAASVFESRKPVPSTSKSLSLTSDEDSELDEPSRIDPDADVSRTSMSLDTPLHPRRGIRHMRHQFRTPPRPEDLPPPPEFPELPNHVRGTLEGEERAGLLDKEFSFPTRSDRVSKSLGPKTPTPPGAWGNGAAVPQDSRIASPETPVGKDPQRIPLTDAKTPAPPGSWAIPISDEGGAPTTQDDNAQLEGQPSAMQTPAPPGAWSSAATAPSASNSLKKGILKVRFDETSVASWNELQRTAGDEGAPEFDNSFTFGHEKVRKPLPGRFHTTSQAQGTQGSSTSSRAGHQTEQNPKSPSNSVRKRKSRLRMVDEFGNALEEQPATEDGEEDEEVPHTESPLHDDDLPATSEEIRGLRRVARAVPQISREFGDESGSMTTPAPITSPADQLRSNDRIADLTELSRTARVERARLQRKLQLVRNSEDTLGDKVSRLQSVIRGPRLGAADDGAQGRWPRSRRWLLAVLSVEIILFYLVLRYTATRAEHLFLTTHFDPFFPAIYSPPAPLTSSSPSSELWNLFLSIAGPSPPPSPPPTSPTHIAFGLIPRVIVPQKLLAFLDEINSLLNADLVASFWSSRAYSAGATWVPS